MPTNKNYYEYMKKSLKEGRKSSKELITMRYVDYVYNIVKADTEGMDAIYKDYIIQMVGIYGFNALHEHKLIEGCGVMNDRYLYVLCEKKEDKC